MRIFTTLKEEINPKTFVLTESQYKELLKESQESKSISAAKKLAMDKMGWDEQRADKFVREELRQDLPALRTRNGGKFILGATRMFFDRQLTDGGIIQQLNRTLELVASDAHINEYDRNLNGMSAQELIDRFATAIKEMGDKDREENAALQLQENNDYTIVQIDNFEQSSQYGKYTSWCVTHNENMLDSYTSNGIGQFYFCLKNGFENVPQERGENCPLDEYGLSMVAVSVDEDGNLNTCTCRWNHDNGGNDHIMGTKQISQLIGKNFYEVFKPNNKWKNALETAMQRLANGEDPETLFDNVEEFETDKKYYYYVSLFNQWNVVVKEKNTEEFKLISPNLWFDNIWNLSDTVFPVEKNNKWNYLKEDGTLLSPNQWFDWVDKKAKDGFSRINLNNKFNVINITNGNLLSPNLWFDGFLGFVNGLAKILLNGSQNLIDTNGNLKLKEWVDNIYYDNDYEKNDNIIFIKKNGKFNFVTIDNFEIQSDVWFDSMGEFIDGLSIVEKHGLYNFVDKNGNLLSNQWFDDASHFREGFARIDINEKENYIDKNGNYLTNQWFYHCSNFKNGFGRVKTEDRKTNFIDQNGNLLCNQWFKEAYPFENGFARVQNGDTSNDEAWNYVKPNGELLCRKWYTNALNFYPDGIAFVEMNGLQNMINTNGEEILNKWVEEIVHLQDNFFAIHYNGKSNFINSEGKLLFDDWFDFYYIVNTNLIKVSKDDKINYIIGGKLLSNLWFDNIELNYGMFSRVTLNGKYNYLKPDGTLLSPNQWFDRAGYFSSYDGTAHVYIDKMRYILNSNGELRKFPQIKHETKQRKTVTITESQVFDLLLEAASLGDVYQKYYSQIPEEEFRQIVAADPTSGENKMGRYSKWLLALYTGGSLKLEDLYKATEYLTIFNKYKGKIVKKDIGQYKSLPELYQVVAPYMDNTQAASHKEEIRKIKEGAEKVYEDDEWLVVVPHTEAAAIEYGRGTQWCTAAEHSDNYFDYYNEQGPLYININKKDGTKYQFHFETNSFMDESDNTFTFDEYHPRLSDGLIDFYTKKYGKGPILNLLYDVVYPLSSNTDYLLVKLGEKWNFVDTKDYELRSKVWFDYMFCNFTASNKCVVGLKGKYNIVNGDGTILLDKWYDEIEQNTATDTFSVMNVMDGGKYAIVDGNCNFVTDFVFDDVSPMIFRGKLANKQWVMVVAKNGKKNIVDDKIQFLLKDWYDEIDFLFRDYIRVYKDGGDIETILDLSTDTAAIPKWYNHIEHFRNLSNDNGVAAAIIHSNGKYNYLATDGINKFWELYDVWFDGVSEFGRGNFGTAIGRIGEKFYTLYSNGEYYERQKPIF